MNRKVLASPARRGTRSSQGQAVRALVAPRDLRDWPRIRAWADGLGAKLT